MRTPRFIKAVRLFLVLFILGPLSCSHEEASQKKILVVVAHPDDETGFGAALAKQSRLGNKVTVVVAVDARNHTQFISAAPDSVAKAKRRDVECSCGKLGVEPLFYEFLSLDRKHGARDGVRDAVETGVSFREKLKQTLLEVQPDLIITFGPDGEYGHPEHIIVGSLVTELLLREGWVSKYPLYYFGWTRSQEANGDGWVRYAEDGYFNVVVNYTDEDEARAMESIRCYTSGFSPAEMNEMIEFERTRKNELYFRRFQVAEGLHSDFFD
ncbi:MAG: PIG-L family deacetylase [Cyclobacteriaceae bacterium]|nr:PIG-L family deacetylase [Cyclobacteriaceae bacterium]